LEREREQIMNAAIARAGWSNSTRYSRIGCWKKIKNRSWRSESGSKSESRSKSCIYSWWSCSVSYSVSRSWSESRRRSCGRSKYARSAIIKDMNSKIYVVHWGMWEEISYLGFYDTLQAARERVIEVVDSGSNSCYTRDGSIMISEFDLNTSINEMKGIEIQRWTGRDESEYERY
jgi:hypothetical protein